MTGTLAPCSHNIVHNIRLPVLEICLLIKPVGPSTPAFRPFSLVPHIEPQPQARPLLAHHIARALGGNNVPRFGEQSRVLSGVFSSIGGYDRKYTDILPNGSSTSPVDLLLIAHVAFVPYIEVSPSAGYSHSRDNLPLGPSLLWMDTFGCATRY